MKVIVILISGRGTNLEAIASACRAETWPARIAAVVSSRADAAGLAVARRLGIDAHVVDRRAYRDRAGFEAALARALDSYAPDAVVLAGFMCVLSSDFVARYRGRMLNIHPSLLPAFPGLATHRRALDAGVTVHGATVHFVTPDLDAGPVIEQAAIDVRRDDTEQSLAARVLEQEHLLYPRVLRRFVEGAVRLDGQRVAVDGVHAPAPAALADPVDP